MSHTTYINEVKITNLYALRSACAELQRTTGVKLSITANAVPKAYFNNQAGLSEAAALVLAVEGAPYEIGVYPASKAGEYELRADLYSGARIQQVLGVPGGRPAGDPTVSTAQTYLGRLLQMYAVHATEQAVLANGGQSERVAQNDGTIQLVIRQAA
jgi:hypothetical protein